MAKTPAFGLLSMNLHLSLDHSRLLLKMNLIPAKLLLLFLDIQTKYRWILCVVGVHQGCPLESLLCCLGALDVLKRILLKFPTIRVPSIADNMILVGPQLDVAAVFVELKASLIRELGLDVAPHNCKAICTTSIQPKTMKRLEAAGLSNEHKPFPSNRFLLCGVPVSVDFEID